MRSPSITPFGRAIWSLFPGALLASPTLGEETVPLPSGTNGDSEIEPDAVTLELYSRPTVSLRSSQNTPPAPH